MTENLFLIVILRNWMYILSLCNALQKELALIKRIIRWALNGSRIESACMLYQQRIIVSVGCVRQIDVRFLLFLCFGIVFAVSHKCTRTTNITNINKAIIFRSEWPLNGVAFFHCESDASYAQCRTASRHFWSLRKECVAEDAKRWNSPECKVRKR